MSKFFNLIDYYSKNDSIMGYLVSYSNSMVDLFA